MPTDEEIDALVQQLPLGPLGRASVADLMRSRGLTVVDAYIEYAREAAVEIHQRLINEASARQARDQLGPAGG